MGNATTDIAEEVELALCSGHDQHVLLSFGKDVVVTRTRSLARRHEGHSESSTVLLVLPTAVSPLLLAMHGQHIHRAVVCFLLTLIPLYVQVVGSLHQPIWSQSLWGQECCPCLLPCHGWAG